MKRSIALAVVIIGLLSILQMTGAAELEKMWGRWHLTQDAFVYGLEAEGVAVIDQDTGELLLSKHEKKRLYPASTTKILTALLAIELGDLDEQVTVGEEILRIGSDESKAGLQVGESLSLAELLNALMLPSGNDAANTIAVHIARKVSNEPQLESDEAFQLFASLMNERARQTGATDSHFVNPHGLHDRKHYTTAYDMALIAQEAMRNQSFREIVRTDVYDRDVMEQNHPEKEVFVNRNELLQEGSEHYFAGTTGIKTGFTSQAGSCLVSSATRNGVDLIAVVLHSTEEDVWHDSIELLEYGFHEKKG